MIKKIFILICCLVVFSGCSSNVKNNKKKVFKKQEHTKSYKIKIKNNPEVPSW